MGSIFRMVSAPLSCAGSCLLFFVFFSTVTLMRVGEAVKCAFEETFVFRVVFALVFQSVRELSRGGTRRKWGLL